VRTGVLPQAVPPIFKAYYKDTTEINIDLFCETNYL
jgi:hypothetical protein